MKYVVISLIIFLVGFTGIFKPVQNIFGFALAPVQFGLSKTAVGINDAFDFYKNLKELRRDNIKLLEDKIILESEILKLKYLQEENLVLKKELSLNDNRPYSSENLVLVSVMGNPLDVTSSTIFINKGSESGIKVGDNVVIESYIVGIVKDVYAGKSLVELISSSKTPISVYDIDSPNKPEGIAVGYHGTQVKVEKILPNEEINLGDLFVSSGKDGKVLPGLYVGKVKEINFEPSDTLKTLQMQTILDFNKIDRLFVIINK